jgi:hypothetical protein
MTWKTRFVALLLIVGATPAVRAIDVGILLACHACWPACICKTCCDDYCPKPEPCVPQVRCFGCDDYTPKCEPCTPRIRNFGCDLYDRKCEPVFTCPPASELKCGPAQACHCGECARGQHPRRAKR